MRILAVNAIDRQSKYMRVVLTSIQLRSVWQFFRLSNHGRKIQGQAKKSPGFVKMKNTGWGRLHYTMSIWQSEAEMKAFAKTGAHLDAMKQSAKIAVEIRTYTYEADRLPEWQLAKELLRDKGKAIKFP